MLMIHIIFMDYTLSGWTYKGYVLGNPFIDFKNNNQRKVMHLGINEF